MDYFIGGIIRLLDWVFFAFQHSLERRGFSYGYLVATIFTGGLVGVLLSLNMFPPNIWGTIWLIALSLLFLWCLYNVIVDLYHGFNNRKRNEYDNY
jgi:multisubunit Na+/H+ antiporter MnhE subunit